MSRDSSTYAMQSYGWPTRQKEREKLAVKRKRDVKTKNYSPLPAGILCVRGVYVQKVFASRVSQAESSS